MLNNISLNIMKNLEESSYSRIWSHTKDSSTFAIIGSEDKDTKENRYDELKELVKQSMTMYPNLGYNKVNGTYKYANGDSANEKSLIIYNIPIEGAVRIAARINQESIVWKDKDFFGIIDLAGNILETFNNHEENMNFSKGKQGFSTKLQKDQTRNSGFVFESPKITKNK